MSSTASKTSIELRKPRIALTAGEPAGIGPDLCAMLAQRLPEADITVIADRTLIESRAHQLGLPLGDLAIYHIPLAHAAVPGQLDARNGARLRCVPEPVDRRRRAQTNPAGAATKLELVDLRGEAARGPVFERPRKLRLSSYLDRGILQRPSHNLEGER